jgi:hypothetical protein
MGEHVFGAMGHELRAVLTLVILQFSHTIFIFFMVDHGGP